MLLLLGESEITATLRCQMKKKKNLFFKTKTGTKQGLIVFRWVLPDSSLCYFFNKPLAGLQKAAASLHLSLSDNTAQPFRHNKSWDFIERHLRSHDKTQDKTQKPSLWTAPSGLLLSPQLSTFDRCLGSFRRETFTFNHCVLPRCDCFVLDVCEGVFMLICDCWFSCFLFPLRTLWLNSQSAPYVLWRCVRLLQSSQETDDWDISHDKYILENTLNPAGGG